jgi:tRNA (cytidine32/uridine32-2'-O)-methyltransferase
VQVLAYELRLALLGAAIGERAARTEALAPHAALEGFFAQLGETLDAIDFHKGRAPESAMRKLRRLFLRSELDMPEVRLLRGILADAQRMARLAGAQAPIERVHAEKITPKPLSEPPQIG